MINSIEDVIFRLIAGPWLFLIIGVVCILTGTKFSPIFKVLYKPKEQLMTEQSGCALLLVGFVFLGVAAILWKLA